jgi:hypothetical protein
MKGAREGARSKEQENTLPSIKFMKPKKSYHKNI